MSTPARILSTKLAANYIGVSPSTLEHWRVEKTGPAFIRIGKKVGYLLHDLDAYLLACKVAFADGGVL